MITYTATNTKTGQFYIGSALSYCRYMARMGTHHTMQPGKGYTRFQKDLQADPLAFKWEWSEDDRDDRDTEKSLIALYRDSKFLYNVGEGRYEGINNPRRGHTEETKQKISAAAKKDSARRSKQLSAVVNKKEPCPHCGKLMNPGNLKQHLRAGTCQTT
jgi:hypothetical protein